MSPSHPPLFAASRLFYLQPSEVWTDALPLGNGRIGAMVYGGVAQETVSLNENTLWAGGPHIYDNPAALEALPEIRRLIFAGEFAKAHRLTDEKFMGLPVRQMPYSSPGSLHLHFFDAAGTNPAASDYRRELDLETAISRTEFVKNGVHFVREAFVSYPDQILVIRLASDTPGSLNLTATLVSELEAVSAPAAPDTLSLRGIGNRAEEIPGTIRFTVLVRALAEGGNVTSEADPPCLQIENANAVTLLVSIGTSFQDRENVNGDADKTAQAFLDAASPKTYADLKTAHRQDYTLLYGRVKLDLGESELSSRPTDRRLLTFLQDNDPALAALYYHYGRYLLIACSRPGGQPATLQGLWNSSLAPPWGSKYTININTEMNYWPSEPAHLPECHEPLFDLIAQIAETGRETAQTMYGAKRGWVAHHNTDLWRGTAPVDGSPWGMWPMGGAWLCTHLWTRFEYSRDLETLRKHFPLLKGAAEFFLETLVPEPTHGWRVNCPSLSPENEHHPGVSLCAGPAMDTQILRDLFSACIEASRLLDREPDFRKEVEAMLTQLPPMQIGRGGQLQEWLRDWDLEVPEPLHRHVSHLYGLYPSRQINPHETPELFRAAKKTLELRGDGGTGWSLAWKINFWARLLDGDHALELIRQALTFVETQNVHYHGGGGVYRNLFDAHPPFQIDGNFGFVSGVTEMLLQSHEDEISLLPALPSFWQNGSITGIRARGGVEVSFRWKAGQVTEVTLLSTLGGEKTIQAGNKRKTVFLEAGQTLLLKGEDFV